MLFVHKKHAVTAAQRIKADFNVSMRRLQCEHEEAA